MQLCFIIFFSLFQDCVTRTCLQCLETVCATRESREIKGNKDKDADEMMMIRMIVMMMVMITMMT